MPSAADFNTRLSTKYSSSFPVAAGGVSPAAFGVTGAVAAGALLAGALVAGAAAAFFPQAQQ